MNEDETIEQNTIKDCDKNGMSVMKLMEMIEDTMQSEQEDGEGKLDLWLWLRYATKIGVVTQKRKVRRMK